MEMSITRALSELKLLSSRINRAIESSSFIVANKKSAKKVNNVYTTQEFIDNAKSTYQSIVDLIERRKEIKSKIVDSNAKTMITVAGKEMSVAEAIERKDSIAFEKMLVEHMQRQYNSSLALASRNNEQVQIKLDELLLVTFGKEGKQKTSESEISMISNPYLEQNEWELINPLLLQDKIESMRKEIEEFENEVDFILSESNTITKITIKD